MAIFHYLILFISISANAQDLASEIQTEVVKLSSAVKFNEDLVATRKAEVWSCPVKTGPSSRLISVPPSLA